MQPGAKIAEIRIDLARLVVRGRIVLLLLSAAGIHAARVHPDYAPFAAWHLLALVASIAALMVVHEGLHAVGLLCFSGVRWRDIRFGFLGFLTPYCHCEAPISLRAYRLMALLPLAVTSLIVIGILAAWPMIWTGLLAGIAIGGCIGDVWMVARLRCFRSDAIIVDLPAEIGCDVYQAS